jgi:hypothetical protein
MSQGSARLELDGTSAQELQRGVGETANTKRVPASDGAIHFPSVPKLLPVALLATDPIELSILCVIHHITKLAAQNVGRTLTTATQLHTGLA